MLIILSENLFSAVSAPVITPGTPYQISEEEYNRLKEEEVKKNMNQLPNVYGDKPLTPEIPENETGTQYIYKLTSALQQ